MFGLLMVFSRYAFSDSTLSCPSSLRFIPTEAAGGITLNALPPCIFVTAQVVRIIAFSSPPEARHTYRLCELPRERMILHNRSAFIHYKSRAYPPLFKQVHDRGTGGFVDFFLTGKSKVNIMLRGKSICAQLLRRFHDPAERPLCIQSPSSLNHAAFHDSPSSDTACHLRLQTLADISHAPWDKATGEDPEIF